MIIRVNSQDFAQAFENMGRGENFSRDGLEALFEHLEEANGEDWELDVIAICCEFTEYETALEAAKEGGFEPDEDEDEDEREESALKWLNDRTFVIEFNGGIIIQDY